MKTYNVKTKYGNYEVNIELDKYRFDDSLAITLVDANTAEPFARLTVCIADDLGLPYFGVGEDTSFVDTNNCDWAEDFIKENGLGKPTGFKGRSGFCTYPLYKFDLKKLKE